jgi:hypothetical protein
MSKAKSGRELDALVAEKVMGWQWFVSAQTGRRALFHPRGLPDWFSKPATGTEDIARNWDPFPEYSSDIAAAWKVIGQIMGPFIDVSVTEVGPYRNDGCSKCEITWSNDEDDPQEYSLQEIADEAPLAICRAALRFVEARGKMLSLNRRSHSNSQGDHDVR